MSFILDALKKSETDRQRQTGPALFEVKVAPPKAGFPVWAIAIVVLLVINMVIVGWLLLRRSSKSEADAQPPVVSQPAPTPPPSAAISQPAADQHRAPTGPEHQRASAAGLFTASGSKSVGNRPRRSGGQCPGAQTDDQVAGRADAWARPKRANPR